ncbi:MAG: hypothetical protein Q9227_007864 [Pyrenula ochraceoflavens]
MPKSSRQYSVEFFIPREGISSSVLKRDLADYIGDAEIKLTRYKGREGFMIKADQALQKHQLADLKANSIREASHASHGENGVGTRRPKDYRAYTSQTFDVDDRTSIYAGGPRQTPASSRYENIQGARLAHELAQSRKPKPTFTHAYTDSPSSVIAKSYYFAPHDESDSEFGSRRGSALSASSIAPQDSKRTYSDEIGMPPIDELELSDHGSKHGSQGSGRFSVQDERYYRSELGSFKGDPYPLYRAEDQESEYVVERPAVRSKKLREPFTTDKQSRPYYVEKRLKAADRQVLFDEKDSVSGTQPVVRHPRDPVRRASTSQNERSRRLQEYADREEAEEQEVFRRAKFRESPKYVDEDEATEYSLRSERPPDDGRRGEATRRTRHPGTYDRPRPRHYAERYDDDGEKEPPWGGIVGFRYHNSEQNSQFSRRPVRVDDDDLHEDTVGFSREADPAVDRSYTAYLERRRGKSQ